MLVSCVPVLETTEPAATPPPNHPPVIENLIAPDEMYVNTTAGVFCAASDSDNDSHLTYEWYAESGVINGSTENVTWTAPTIEGKYVITVYVTDSEGEKDSKCISVEVIDTPNTAPEISDIVITKQDNTVLTVMPGDARPILTRQWSVLSLECKAFDLEDNVIKYVWKCNGGKIVEQGDTAKFIPYDKGECVVTVTAEDERGASSMMEVFFYAACCGDIPVGVREK